MLGKENQIDKDLLGYDIFREFTSSFYLLEADTGLT